MFRVFIIDRDLIDSVHFFFPSKHTQVEKVRCFILFF